MNEEVLLTREGFEKIQEEHEHAVSVRRAEIAERLKEARSFGDLSENAEYDAAKEEQAELEERINKLEQMIRNAKIIDEVEDGADGPTKVNVGYTVVLKEQGSDETVQYQIVGSTETDPFAGRISNESAVGKALIGAGVGEVVEVEIPDGKIFYEVVEINK